IYNAKLFVFSIMGGRPEAGSCGWVGWHAYGQPDLIRQLGREGAYYILMYDLISVRTQNERHRPRKFTSSNPTAPHSPHE
ncbi:MAG TPA: hypothetical protein PLJ13_11125, partial [Cyclobacteriaceae bacterium]|nr:hypothetical protein [Cyclobacteriaceae bacterium]